MSSHQYVYVMHRLSKVWPGGKEVLKNISLSFLPGAKIGVLGLNGAGKSTLLRIMAGIETEFQGEAWAADGIKVGYLPQDQNWTRHWMSLVMCWLAWGGRKSLSTASMR